MNAHCTADTEKVHCFGYRLPSAQPGEGSVDTAVGSHVQSDSCIPSSKEFTPKHMRGNYLGNTCVVNSMNKGQFSSQADFWLTVTTLSYFALCHVKFQDHVLILNSLKRGEPFTPVANLKQALIEVEVWCLVRLGATSMRSPPPTEEILLLHEWASWWQGVWAATITARTWWLYRKSSYEVRYFKGFFVTGF